MTRTALLFPGQGAQKIGMGQVLVDRLPAARQLFEEAADVLGYDLLALCLNGPPERLNATDVSQPAIFVASLAALEAVRVDEPEAIAECVATAGLSLGEYTALVFAGAMTFADGLRVVKCRGEAMQAAADASPGAMISVLGPEIAEVEQLVQIARESSTLELANYLCPGNTVVSGSSPACDALVKLLDSRGGKATRLAVAGAFHTDLMRPADEKLAHALRGVELKSPRIPVWSNVDARPHTEPEEIRTLLVRQVVSPVQWERTMRDMFAVGVERFYEIGPGRVLAGLLKRVNRKVECRNYPA